jgi:hypothetical protein
VEHRYTATEDGSSAGCWWDPSGLWPQLAWRYDRRRRVMVVTTRAGRTIEHRVAADAPMPAEPRGMFFPGLALQIARRAALR